MAGNYKSHFEQMAKKFRRENAKEFPVFHQAYNERKRYVENKCSGKISKQAATFSADIITWYHFWPNESYPALNWLPKDNHAFGSLDKDQEQESLYDVFMKHIAYDSTVEGIDLSRKIKDKTKQTTSPEQMERIGKGKEEQAKQARKDRISPFSTEMGGGNAPDVGECKARVQESGDHVDEGLSEAMDISDPETDNDNVLVARTMEDKQVEEGELSTVQTQTRPRIKRGLRRAGGGRRGNKKRAMQAQEDKTLHCSTEPRADTVSNHDMDKTAGQAEAGNTKGFKEDNVVFDGGLSEDMDIFDREADDDEALIVVKIEAEEPVACELCGRSGHDGKSCPKQCPNWRCFRELHRAEDCPLVF